MKKIKILKSFSSKPKPNLQGDTLKGKDLLSYLSSRRCLYQSSNPTFQIKDGDKVYIGIDPTSSKIHIGNYVGILNAMRCAAFGLSPVFLIGGATGMIGDPKIDKERSQIEKKVIEENSSSIKIIINQIVNSILNSKSFDSLLSHTNYPKDKINYTLVNNKDFYKDLNIISFLREVGFNMRMGPMLGREIIKNRISTDEGLCLSEFMYQSFQAYDFYYLYKNFNVKVQLGGSDQWGNMISGLELISKKMNGNGTDKSDEVVNITHPLLTTSCGKKLGKSEGNSISICNENPNLMYQYILNLADDDIEDLLYKLTFLREEEIKEIVSEHLKSPEKRDGQRRLAEEVLKDYVSKEKIDECRFLSMNYKTEDLSVEYFKQTTKTCVLSNNILGRKVSQFLQEQNLFSSKTQIKKLIDTRSVKINNHIMEKDKVISSEDLFEGEFFLVQTGKSKRFVFQILE